MMGSSRPYCSANLTAAGAVATPGTTKEKAFISEMKEDIVRKGEAVDKLAFSDFTHTGNDLWQRLSLAKALAHGAVTRERPKACQHQIAYPR